MAVLIKLSIMRTIKPKRTNNTKTKKDLAPALKTIKTESNEPDLFPFYESLPENVQAVLTMFSYMDNTYEECEKLVKALNTIGYTCDYGLDAVPFNLRKL